MRRPTWFRRRQTSILTIAVFALFAAWTLFYIYYIIHVNATCDGHVLKNMFDWPVCVK